MDWDSRKVLAWRVSNTLEVAFCVEALEAALLDYGNPEIFNSDQGSQFTSKAFTDCLKAAEVMISMDGRGQYLYSPTARKWTFRASFSINNTIRVVFMSESKEEREMIRIDFTPEEIAELKYERYHYPHPKVQQKMEVLYLKSQGLAHQEIRRLCEISKTTLTVYLTQYQAGRIKGLKQLDDRGQPSPRNAHAATVETHFRAHPPQTIAEAQAQIEELTGIRRSPTQVNAFLQRIGMKRCKVRFIPGKSNDPNKLAEQEIVREQQLEPLLEEAKAGKQAVFLSMLLILFTPLF